MFEMVAVISIAIIAALALIMLGACILFVQKNQRNNFERHARIKTRVQQGERLTRPFPLYFCEKEKDHERYHSKFETSIADDP